MAGVPNENDMKNALILRQGRELTEKLSKSCVAVCGLGGLGSNIAVSLARAGVGRLILIDFDKVDITNLHRQQYKASQVGMLKTDALRDNLKEIAPYIKIEIYNAFINSENAPKLLSDADIICEAFDKAECKAELVNTVLEKLSGKYIAAASGMAGMGTPNEIKTRRISKYFYLSGDEVSDIQNEISLTAPRVMLCAAHQASVVLRIIAGEYDI